MEDGGTNPAVQGRRLRTELRKARLAAGLTQDQAAGEMDSSPSKIIRIENGSVKVSTNDLKAFLNIYRIADEDRREEFLALARGAKARSWWSQYRHVAPKDLLEFIEEESIAAAMISFQPLLVPGLLQTEGYARASIRSLDPRLTTEQAEARVELRMRRQELLVRPDPPELHFILGEAVIRAVVGGHDVMRPQIRSLMDMPRKRDLTIRVVPFGAGIHFGMLTPFVVFEFPDESGQGVLYLESPDHPQRSG
jgi:transcriptional regulator with XRE-family HTH domain